MRRLGQIWMVVAVLVGQSSTLLGGTYGGGSGTEEDPYQIWTAEQMNTIGLTPNDWWRHFMLMDDIDMSSYSNTQYNIIGTSSKPFTGTFDGNGHIISNLTYTTNNYIQYVGLFGRTISSSIQNLGLENVLFSTAGSTVGGVVGLNGGVINACYVTGSISGSVGVGGLVGDDYGGTIRACYATCVVMGTGQAIYIGGLVGFSEKSSLTACYATGSVNGAGSIGGVVGHSDPGTVNACFWDMQTSGCTSSSGGKGLTTEQMKTLTIFQNAGWSDKAWVLNDGVDYPRLSWENAGGIPIPLPQPIPLPGNGTTEEPYLVSTPQDFALLSWYEYVLDKHILLTTDLDVSGLMLYPIGDLGAVTGVFDGHGHAINNAVIDQPNSDCIGLFGHIGSSGEIRNLSVVNITVDGSGYVGGLAGSNAGTLAACHVSGTINGVVHVGGLVGSNDGFLTACCSTTPVSGSGFVGGLVGSNAGTITACHVNSTVAGYSYVGGLAGHLIGGGTCTIKSCYATGSVTGSFYVGGLVGESFKHIITSCYATGSITGSSYVGGLVGANFESTIRNSYASGYVMGSTDVGGLVGRSELEEWHCEWICDEWDCWEECGYVVIVAPQLVEDSFWDVEMSGQNTSSGGLDESTAGMKTRTIFLDAGWDFTNESANGIADIWHLCEDGSDYPHLAWEFGPDYSCPDGVSVEDLLYLSTHWLESDLDPYTSADRTGDGVVNMKDWGLLSQQWLNNQ
ncbi:MAG: hypothetical protein JXA82_08330 [Sedimentisphaerales bacterium]|nr:hypothetical protein [Sedimentisphaerales bacterium]